jgi:hypothetical protein
MRIYQRRRPHREVKNLQLQMQLRRAARRAAMFLPVVSTAAVPPPDDKQKFFGSFLQKRTASLSLACVKPAAGFQECDARRRPVAPPPRRHITNLRIS